MHTAITSSVESILIFSTASHMIDFQIEFETKLILSAYIRHTKISIMTVVCTHICNFILADLYEYLGCFKDDTPRALVHSVPMVDTTISKCVEECKRLKYTFAGLQVS